MKPIKHLGQNFLTSKKIVEDIVRAADLKPDDVVLEVGPGKGILTEAILEKIPQGKLIVIEKDKRLIELLTQKFCYSKNLGVVHDDILKFNPIGHGLVVNGYKIVANIPYYITSRFLRNFLQSDFQPSKMVLMIQKEVAERIIAKDKKESILSVSVKVYGEPRIIKRVPASYFSPRPKVDSAILLIDNISKSFFDECARPSLAHEKEFFSLVKQGFSSKRKLLKNNLKLLNTECSTIFRKCKIAGKARAEDLSPENWECLYKNLA